MYLFWHILNMRMRRLFRIGQNKHFDFIFYLICTFTQQINLRMFIDNEQEVWS